MRAGRSDEAIARWRAALELDRGFAEAHNNLGLALLGRDSVEEAMKCFRTALSLRPDFAIAWNNLGNALRSLGKSDQALDCYREAARIAPAFAPSHYNLGKALSDFGKLEEASAEYRRAVALDADFADAWNSLGIILWELGERGDAEASLREAIRLRPDFAKAHFNLHSVLVDAANLTPAIECLEKVLRLTPEDAEAHFFFGMLLDYSGQAKAAAPHLDMAAGGPAWTRASLDSYRYMKGASPELPLLIGSPRDAFALGLRSAACRGLVLELGVRFGESIRQIAALAHQEVHGFDSFEGLPEAWHGEPRGAYSTRGELPQVPDGVHLHKGWFEDTLPAFLRSHDGPVRFMNIDCDIYSSTRAALELLAPRIAVGTVIAFDEFLGHEHWREDEFRAFQDAVARHGWHYKYLAFSLCTRQAVVRIEAVRDRRSEDEPPTG